MIRGYPCGVLLMVLSCWAPLAAADAAASGVAASAASGVAASAVKAAPTPEEDYQAARKAGQEGDMLDAARLFRRAAEGGHAAAQARVAEIFWQGSAKEEAVKWFRKAAEQGNAEGQFGLGMMYMADQSEPKWEQKRDYAEAHKWLARAADQGNKQAITILADAYINGKMDLDEKARSSPEALKWIRRGADIDDAVAIKALADAYRSGRYGLAVDTKQADELDARVKVEEKKKKKTKTR